MQKARLFGQVIIINLDGPWKRKVLASPNTRSRNVARLLYASDRDPIINRPSGRDSS